GAPLGGAIGARTSGGATGPGGGGAAATTGRERCTRARTKKKPPTPPATATTSIPSTSGSFDGDLRLPPAPLFVAAPPFCAAPPFFTPMAPPRWTEGVGSFCP